MDDVKEKRSWLTSSRAKALAMLLPAIGSTVAIIIASFKPTGFEASAKAYDLLKQEITEQRAEIMQVNKSLAELQAWVTIWRDHENKMIEETQGKLSVLTPVVPKQVAARRPAVAIVKVSAAQNDTQQIPPPPPPPPAPRSRAALPDKSLLGL